MSPKDIKLALGVAIDFLSQRGCTPRRHPLDPERWVYFADETGSWWSVPCESLIALVERIDAGDESAYDTWAEADKLGLEIGQREARRLGLAS